MRVKIKTREALKTIKTFDRADSLAQKSKQGIPSIRDSAEQTQNAGYESGTDYAGSELQDKEALVARTAVTGIGKIGQWGLRETGKNLKKRRSCPPKRKSNPKMKSLPPSQRQALPPASNRIKSTAGGAKTTAKGSTTTAKASAKAAQAMKKAATSAVKYAKIAVKAVIKAGKAVVATAKGIVAAIAAGGWIAVLIIVIMVLIGLVVGSVYAVFTPSEDGGMTIHSVKADLEREYHQRQAELIAGQKYDILIHLNEKENG